MTGKSSEECLMSPAWILILFWRVIEFFWWILGIVILFGCLYLLVAIPWHYISPATTPFYYKDSQSHIQNLIVFPLSLFLVYYSFFHVVKRPVEWFWPNKHKSGLVVKIESQKLTYFYKGSERKRTAYILTDDDGESWEVTESVYKKLKLSGKVYFRIVFTPVDREVRYLYVSAQPLT